MWAAVTLTAAPTVGGVKSSWVLDFDTSSAGALTAGSTITVHVAGADFSGVTNCGAGVASPPSGSESCTTVSTSNGGSSLIMTLGASPVIGNSAQVKVDLSPLQLSNPPGGTPFSAITVATSADTVPAAVGTVGQFTVPQPVNNLNFSPSSTAGGRRPG